MSSTDHHTIDVTVIHDADQQAALDSDIYAAKHIVMTLLSQWRERHKSQQVVRGTYRGRSDAQIELRSGSPTHVFVARTDADGSITYDFNSENDDISVVRITKRGKHTLLVDDLVNYTELARILYGIV